MDNPAMTLSHDLRGDQLVPLTYGSLFTGIGGFDLGLDRAGMKCMWQVENDKNCQRVLARHWPDVMKMEDVRSVTGQTVSTVDLICGGFPCQDISHARQNGDKHRGLDGERSGLWKEYARIVGEIKPRWVVIENVRRLLTINNGRDFGIILNDLAHFGYDAEWAVLSAGQFGFPHKRERLFVVANTHSVRWMDAQIFGRTNSEAGGAGGGNGD